MTRPGSFPARLARIASSRARSLLPVALIPYTPPGRSCHAGTARCDFWNRGPDAVRPPCCTRHLMELATFTRDLLSRHGIVSWLDYGMLLGAVRSGSLIPWDEDGDIGILARDRERVIALRDEITAAGHVLDLSDPKVICIRYSRTNTIQIDIYPWIPDDGLLTLDINWYAWPGMHRRDAFPMSFVSGREPVLLEGEAFPAPAPAADFLVHHRYGPDYLTPVRPPARRHLAVPDVAQEDLTPGVKDLLAELGRLEKVVDALYFGSRAHLSPFGERWIAAGFPVRPRRRRVARRRAGLAARDRGPAADKLLESLDMLERAIEERRRPWPFGLGRRLFRRTVRILR